MPVNLVVAVTDLVWFRNLSQRQDLNEVNHWAPNPYNFRALQPGELFLFKLKHPANRIVGGATFVHANILPISTAWEDFEIANGANSLEELRARIVGAGNVDNIQGVDLDIGCRILAQPFFLNENEWIAPPTSFVSSINRYKVYSTDEQEGLDLWNVVEEKRARFLEARLGEPVPRYGAPQLVPTRIGQGAFRNSVRDAYGRRCAVTGEATLPALDAAHIHDYRRGGSNQVSNGLLLRKDIHSLFDKGYVTITPTFRFRVSPSIREKFGNGREYYALHGTQIAVPARVDSRPNPSLLEWHNENTYKG